MNQQFQYLVKEIKIEEAGKEQKKYKKTPEKVVALNFRKTKVPIFKYVPRYSEIRAWMKLTIEVRGKEDVEKELGVKIIEEDECYKETVK